MWKTYTANKYRAVRCQVDGFNFDSKMEANYYMLLKDMQAKGEIKFFLRQVPFHLPCNIKYVCDFAVFDADGVQFVDVKGVETQAFKIKKKQVEALFNIKIQRYYANQSLCKTKT